MSEHLTQKTLESYRQRLLDAADLMSVGEHLSQCEQCRQKAQRLLSANRVGDAQLTLFTSPHLTESLLEGYARNNLTPEDQLSVDDHLTECSGCRVEALSWRAHVVEDEIAAQASVAAARSNYSSAATLSAPASWRERARAWLYRTFPVGGGKLRIAGYGALAVVLPGMAALAILLYLQKQPPEPQAAQTNNNPLVTSVVTPADTTSPPNGKTSGTPGITTNRPSAVSSPHVVGETQPAKPTAPKTRPVPAPSPEEVYRDLTGDDDDSATMGGSAEGNGEAQPLHVRYRLKGKILELQWAPLPGLTDYAVVVQTADYSRVVCRSSGKIAQLTCRLTTDGSYHVQVTPLKNGERQNHQAGRGKVILPASKKK